MEKQTDVQNINGLTEDQELMKDRAQRILDILDEEPKMKLFPFIRFNEHAIRPDVRLVFKDARPTKESAGSENQPAADQPTEPSDGTGSGTDTAN